ncbi:oxidoreductase [Rhodococcus sp. NBC_00294]|uniref:oxidoreductase n=1 Tax=Rhodococcus sp. NBC_00294 TaxID=2976004 RepID=UPI002E2D17E4|nr:12-oxophytodienoate reductase [Rhodococcus sp. NBC_00294]
MSDHVAGTTRTPVLGPLFTEFTASTLTVRNRFAMAPMTRESSPGGIPTADNVEYYRQRAAGGVGVVFTEGTLIPAPAAGSSAAMPHMYGDDSAAGWRQVVDAVHTEGAAIVSQLMHMGVMRGATAEFEPDLPSVGPSGIGVDGEPLGRPLDRADMDSILQAYVDAATLAAELGFDGVEIHGAHGMILDTFVWSRTNRRTDRYGGSLHDRVRFPTEVVSAVRAAVGPHFPISYRFSQWKVGAYDAQVAATPTELESILAPLADAGVDIFHPSTRRHWQPAFPSEPSSDSTLGLSGWAKKVTGRPAIMVGSVAVDRPFVGDEAADGHDDEEKLNVVVEKFERGEFDLLALGRPLLADPAWVNKMKFDDRDAVVPFH